PVHYVILRSSRGVRPLRQQHFVEIAVIAAAGLITLRRRLGETCSHRALISRPVQSILLALGADDLAGILDHTAAVPVLSGVHVLGLDKTLADLDRVQL